MASSSSQHLTTLPTTSQVELITLTNALSLALDNDVDASDMQILRSDAKQTDIVVGGKHLSIMFDNQASLKILEGKPARPDSSHLTRPGSFHGPPNPLGSHPPSPPMSPPAKHSTCRDAPASSHVHFGLTAQQLQRENKPHAKLVETEPAALALSKKELIKSIAKHILRKKSS
ncbi:hypothetical protein PRZ48_014741 [Zasmidium cellare]|uniref:Uncharacterized protein n=1 Tax=Zasmidium cellare TaxID=395010 RepID=A0ABR0DZV5_ZASCE|nr:hypothetical protein PRZ48_014741 [Zasmidium cellare]